MLVYQRVVLVREGSDSSWWQLKYFSFSTLFGEDEPNLTIIFFRWVVQPPTRDLFHAQESIWKVQIICFIWIPSKEQF